MKKILLATSLFFIISGVFLFSSRFFTTTYAGESDPCRSECLPSCARRGGHCDRRWKVCKDAAGAIGYAWTHVCIGGGGGGGGGGLPTATPAPTSGVSGTPTPTENPDCKCNNLKNCTAACNSAFQKFTDITYPNTIKCGLANNLFQSTPTASDKTGWCQAEMRTKGDADGNGNASLKDYFYYVAAKWGAKLPPSVNPDFNGDNKIDEKDREIIIKSLTGNTADE